MEYDLRGFHWMQVLPSLIMPLGNLGCVGSIILDGRELRWSQMIQ